MAFTNDIEILNYALTLEYMEMEMYRRAVNSGRLSGKALRYAQEFLGHEATHVNTLIDTIMRLGGTPVRARPSYSFPAFETETGILSFIAQVEDTGVGAYLGQVGSLQSEALLAAAASIYAVEALHAGAIRTLLGQSANPNGAFEKPLNSEQVLAMAGPLLGPETAAPTGPQTTGNLPPPNAPRSLDPIQRRQ